MEDAGEGPEAGTGDGAADMAGLGRVLRQVWPRAPWRPARQRPMPIQPTAAWSIPYMTHGGGSSVTPADISASHGVTPAAR